MNYSLEKKLKIYSLDNVQTGNITGIKTYLEALRITSSSELYATLNYSRNVTMYLTNSRNDAISF